MTPPSRMNSVGNAPTAETSTSRIGSKPFVFVSTINLPRAISCLTKISSIFVASMMLMN